MNSMTIRAIALCLGLWTTAGTAQAGLIPTPPTAIASAIGLAACLEAAAIDGKITWGERIACYSIAFDPLAETVTGIELALTFDPNKIQFEDAVYFFGDLSASGAYLPLTTPIYGSDVPLTPVPDLTVFDPDGSDMPRPGTTFVLTVDNMLGTLLLILDFSSNPIPAGVPAQNLFGLNMLTNGQPVTSIQYADTPGSYDVNQVSFVCRSPQGVIGCGSDTPVYGWNITTVPEPASALLLLSGLGAALWMGGGATRMRRGRKRALHRFEYSDLDG
jgi:hypothetical protein